MYRVFYEQFRIPMNFWVIVFVDLDRFVRPLGLDEDFGVIFFALGVDLANLHELDCHLYIPDFVLQVVDLFPSNAQTIHGTRIIQNET